MRVDRREFLRIGGLATVAGLVAGSGGLFTGRAAEASHGEAAAGAAAESPLRYGMVIDTRYFDTEQKFSRAVDACHGIHNVPDLGNPKDEIKWIWKTPFAHAFTGIAHKYMSEKTGDVLVLCNHCENPPCVRVCPTKATFKAANGITMMDFHRCIGCRFCMAACPYGARSFNWRDPRGRDANGAPFIKKVVPEFPTREKGVVEKCSFCEERLAVGKSPACVEASPGGMTFGNLHDPASEVRQVLKHNSTIQRKTELGTNPSVFFIV
jgi:molybdopterin-containing oxidoreductase family iron-sulfur binding subunit